MKSLIKIFLISVLIASSAANMYAQSIVTGTVKDAETGESLLGANVYFVNSLERTLSGSIVNMDGQYQISVPFGEDLSVVYSFIGYKSKKVTYTGQTVLNVELEGDAQTLQDVQVVAQAITRNQLGLTEREITASTQTVTTEMLETAPVLSIEDALQGRMANVDIITSGDPGARSAIRIRGTSSLNASSEPLIVVDGVPYPTDIDDDFNFSTANDEDFGALVNISPNDIASIEVLKDASATAVWGSKGANGVLLIKTKKGTSGKTRFTFSSKVDIRREPNTIPMLDASQYIALMQDEVWNSARDEGFQNSADLMDLLFNTNEIGYDQNWVYFDEYNQQTDWLDEITRVGFSNDNSFSMTGGGDKANYRLSLGYLNDEGTTIGTGFDRISSLLSIKYRFSQKLDITTDFSFSNAERQSYWTNPRGHALSKMPNMSPYYIDEEGNRTAEYFTPNEYFQGTISSIGNGSIGGVYNPVALVHEGINNTSSTNSRFILNLHYKLLPGLDFYSTVGLDIRKTKNKRFLPQSVTGVTWTNDWFNRSADLLSDKVYLNFDNKLIYIKNFADNHKIVFTNIVQANETNNASYRSEVKGNASPSTSDPTAGGTIVSMGSGTSKSREVGFISNFHYALKERYMVNLGYRLEGNSRMGSNNRWGGFPTLGVGWYVSEEDFMKSIAAISSMKVRLSWGQSGNAPGGSYTYIGTFSPITPGYVDMVAIQPSSIQLDNLKWETVTQSNLGIDVGMFNDNLRFTFDVYDKVTTDMLMRNITIPSSTGYSSVGYINSGSMSNTGWEFRTDWNALTKSDWKLMLNFNISQNTNEILELPENLTDYKYSFGNGEYAYQIIEGNPLGSFYGYKYLGVYQNKEETYALDNDGKLINDISGEPVYVRNGGSRVYPGDAKYDDVNGDGVIDQFDIVYLGNSMPLFNGGGGFTFGYKNLTLNAFFHGRAGQKVVNQTRISTENMRGTSNQSTAVLRRWRNEGDDTTIPRALYEKGYNYLGSNRFVEDASFLRLKTLSIRYDLPKDFLKKFNLYKADFYITAYDLMTWTNYTGQDPEVSLSRDDGVAYLIAKDNSSTPKSIRIALGLSIGF